MIVDLCFLLALLSSLHPYLAFTHCSHHRTDGAASEELSVFVDAYKSQSDCGGIGEWLCCARFFKEDGFLYIARWPYRI
ncbi:hypothetical protein KFK09_013832 [Dendrobium nobile]|uniref:Secreted protein n=1 Tax=Dendrobium nobile TaxID=94219 RepID=A0A8T3BA12_DENNO|nr:hypothetical protein KFK09_013832 [Dendrobium nobile]